MRKKEQSSKLPFTTEPELSTNERGIQKTGPLLFFRMNSVTVLFRTHVKMARELVTPGMSAGLPSEPGFTVTVSSMPTAAQ